METNELLTINCDNGYHFEICKELNGFIIMRFSYYNYGLNLSSDKLYKTLPNAIAAGKNILINHFKRSGK